jgi:hypothetical protein
MQTVPLAVDVAWIGRLCFFICVAVACVTLVYWFAKAGIREFQQARGPDVPQPLDYVARADLEWILTQSLLDLRQHRVVVIEGPRLSGKTLLVEKVMAETPSQYIVVDCHGSKPQVEASIRKVASASDDEPAEVVLRKLFDPPEKPTHWIVTLLQFGSRKVLNETDAAAFDDTFVDWVRPQPCPIVLDNLDDGDAAKWLLKTARSAGRKVIVTTQDAQVLRSCKALTDNDEVVRVGAMEPLEALDLALARLRGTKMLSIAADEQSTRRCGTEPSCKTTKFRSCGTMTRCRPNSFPPSTRFAETIVITDRRSSVWSSPN